MRSIGYTFLRSAYKTTYWGTLIFLFIESYLGLVVFVNFPQDRTLGFSNWFQNSFLTQFNLFFYLLILSGYFFVHFSYHVITHYMPSAKKPDGVTPQEISLRYIWFNTSYKIKALYISLLILFLCLDTLYPLIAFHYLPIGAGDTDAHANWKNTVVSVWKFLLIIQSLILIGIGNLFFRNKGKSNKLEL